MHEKDICEFTIDNEGMHLGRPFRNVSGILSGFPQQLHQGEISQLSGLLLDAPASGAGGKPVTGREARSRQYA